MKVHTHRTAFASRLGMTILEVMVAMAILFIASIGLFNGAFWARAVSMDNARRLATTTFIEGVLRQISAMPETTLQRLASDSDASPETVVLRLANVSENGAFNYGDSSFDMNDDNFYDLAVATQSDEARTGRTTASDSLSVMFNPSVSREAYPGGEGHFYEISVRYRYESAVPRRTGPEGFSSEFNISTIRTYVD